MKLYRLSWFNREQPNINGHTLWIKQKTKIVQAMRKLKPIFPQQVFSIEVQG